MRHLSIAFVADRPMQRLNAHYRGKNKPTDVLSFSQLEGERGAAGAASLGDVVISVDTARRQGQEYGVGLRGEVLRLLVHGILHLCGFEHERVPRTRVRQMQRMEDYLCARYLRAAQRW